MLNEYYFQFGIVRGEVELVLSQTNQTQFASLSACHARFSGDDSGLRVDSVLVPISRDRCLRRFWAKLCPGTSRNVFGLDTTGWSLDQPYLHVAQGQPNKIVCRREEGWSAGVPLQSSRMGNSIERIFQDFEHSSWGPRFLLENLCENKRQGEPCQG